MVFPSVTHELLVAMELILGHGFKRKTALLLALNSPPTLWSFVSESLEKFHEPARKTIAYVRSANLRDEQRCGVWLKLCLNEGCLHKMLETLCNDLPAQQLRRWYEGTAFIFSDHMTALLRAARSRRPRTPPHTRTRRTAARRLARQRSSRGLGSGYRLAIGSGRPRARRSG